MTISDSIIVVSRTSVGSLLLVAGFDKARRRGDFASTVRAFSLLPDAVAGVVGAILPIVEILTGAAFVLSTFGEVSLRAGTGMASVAGLVAILLFVGFAIAVGVNVARGRTQISCGCFSHAATGVGWGLVVRNIGLALMTCIGTFSLSGDSWSASELVRQQVLAIFLVLSALMMFRLLLAFRSLNTVSLRGSEGIVSGENRR